jgi:hypothetical protein
MDTAICHNVLGLDPLCLEKFSIFFRVCKSGSGDPILQENEVHRVKKSQKSEFQLDWCVRPVLSDLQGIAVH